MEQSKTTDASGGGYSYSEPKPWPHWSCPNCQCKGFSRLHEKKPDGRFGDGPLICCLDCKHTFDTRPASAPPAPTPEAGSDLDDALEAAGAGHPGVRRRHTTPSPPPAEDLAGQGEPVAWAYECLDVDVWVPRVALDEPKPRAWVRNIRPLYASPAPSRPADRATFTCAARKGNVGAGDPQECDWPVCGCDPHADKVIEALQESGALREGLSRPADREEIAEAAFVQYFLHNATGPEDDWDDATIAWSKERYSDDRRLAYAIADAVLALRDAPRNGGDGR